MHFQTVTLENVCSLAYKISSKSQCKMYMYNIIYQLSVSYFIKYNEYLTVGHSEGTADDNSCYHVKTCLQLHNLFIYYNLMAYQR